MADPTTFTPNVAVMTRPAMPGRVKTRLIGGLSPQQAARVHEAMQRCVLQRARLHVPGRHVVAMEGDPAAEPGSSAGLEGGMAGEIPAGWEVVDQGTGDLGQRLDHVWRGLGEGPIVFLGVDSPDVPAESLRGIVSGLSSADVVLGPAADGGYWTLGSRRYLPSLLEGVDWGTGTVYHQTVQAAARVGASVATLPPWRDVDWPDDLAALRSRLEDGSLEMEPALAELRDRLRQVCEEAP